MAALVLVSSLLAWLSISLGYHFQKRRELVSLCRSDAGYVASFVAEMVQQRPVLWRYDGAKIADRISAQGGRPPHSIIVRDSDNLPVDLGSLGKAPPTQMLWGHAPVLVGGSTVAHVWVGSDSKDLWRNTIVLAIISGLVSAAFGLWLYLSPVRTVARAERNIVGLMSRLTLAMQEDERQRIARDLHDGVGQAITAARLGLLALRKKVASQELSGSFDKIAALLDSSLGEVRRSTTALMPPAIGELGLKGAIERHCEAFGEASGLAIACRFEQQLDASESHAQIACYRIVQEALSNCAKHSGAKNVSLRFFFASQCWHLEISDDGHGFSPQAETKGSGLNSIRERARLLGGDSTVLSSPSGTTISVVFPQNGGSL
jgi:signal transduction histidine kinase